MSSNNNVLLTIKINKTPNKLDKTKKNKQR